MLKISRSTVVIAPFLAIPMSANAASGLTVEGLLLSLLVVGSLFWIAFATITPFRTAIIRIPHSANRLGLLLLAILAFAYAAVSIVLGKTTLGGGIVHEGIEPSWFWILIKFQLGAAFVLLLLSFFAGRRSK